MKTIKKIGYILSALLFLIINFAAAYPIAFTNINVIDMRDEVAILGRDTVYVAPPTGERDTDRASILAALEDARDGNEIADNTFEDITSYAVFIEGDSNRVEVGDLMQEVKDLGSDNQISEADTEQDTLQYMLLPQGIPGGERKVWWEAPNIRHHRLDFRGRVIESVIELNSEGNPVKIEISGMRPNGIPWNEHFEKASEMAIWSTSTEGDSTITSGNEYYLSLEYEISLELPLLAQKLLKQSTKTIQLLPDGEVQIKELEQRQVKVGGQSKTVIHYAIYGIDLAPEYIWLDKNGHLFADKVSILQGWEEVFPELNQLSAEALIEYGHHIFSDLIPSERERPLVIRNANLFDSRNQSLQENTTILIENDRIAAVGPDGNIELPNDAVTIDANGLTVIPGLWDMHIHTQLDWIEELDMPLFIAAGVTTVRDLGSETDLLESIRNRADSGKVIAPRILPSLIMYGPGQSPLGVNVGTPEEARDAVDRFAALGYVQVKLYNPVPADIVPVIIDRARHHGMRVSGHLPNGMTGKDVIENGFDEIQHLFYARIGAADLLLGTDPNVGERMAAIRSDASEWENFVELLKTQDIVIDPTLAVVEESVGRHPPVWLGKVLDRFPDRMGRMASHHTGPKAPPPMLTEHWDEIVAKGPDLVKTLYESDVSLIAGTDAAIGGFELHRELELYVEAGIPAPEVLTLATLGAARVMGMDDELGSIEPGKLADLILVDGDPTKNISDIRRVMTVIKDGKVYDPAAIYRALGIEPCCE